MKKKKPAKHYFFFFYFSIFGTRKVTKYSCFLSLFYFYFIRCSDCLWTCKPSRGKDLSNIFFFFFFNLILGHPIYFDIVKNYSFCFSLFVIICAQTFFKIIYFLFFSPTLNDILTNKFLSLYNESILYLLCFLLLFYFRVLISLLGYK